MKLKDIKKWVNKLTDEELEQEFMYNSEEYSVSGVVDKVVKARGNLYYTGEDDPSPLYTKSQLKEMGMDNEEMSECDVEIPKGAYYITF